MPIIGNADIMEWTGFTATESYKIIDFLLDMGILAALEKGSKRAATAVPAIQSLLFSRSLSTGLSMSLMRLAGMPPRTHHPSGKLFVTTAFAPTTV